MKLADISIEFKTNLSHDALAFVMASGQRCDSNCLEV